MNDDSHAMMNEGGQLDEKRIINFHFFDDLASLLRALWRFLPCGFLDRNREPSSGRETVAARPRAVIQRSTLHLSSLELLER